MNLKPKLETINERMGLIDWKPYGKLVADAYEARPANDPVAHASFKALRTHILKMFTRMQPAVKVIFVDKNPYSSEDELFHDIRKNKTLKVWTGESKHGFWSEQDNWRFRAVHDFITHNAGGHKFDLKGEIAAFNRHAKTAPPAALPALFSEVVGQAAFAIDRGHFGQQKICVLHGFDYIRLGNVDPDGYKKNFPDGKIPGQDAELLKKLAPKPVRRKPDMGVAESLKYLEGLAHTPTEDEIRESAERLDAALLELAETNNLPTETWAKLSEAWLALEDDNVKDLEKKLGQEPEKDPTGRPRGSGTGDSPDVTRDKLIKARIDAGDGPNSPEVVKLLKPFEKHTIELIRHGHNAPGALASWLDVHGFYGGPVFVKSHDVNTTVAEFKGPEGLKKAQARMAQQERGWTDVGGSDIKSSAIEHSTRLFRTPEGYAVRHFTYDSGKYSTGDKRGRPGFVGVKTFFYLLRQGHDVYGKRFVNPQAKRPAGAGEVGGTKPRRSLKTMLKPDDKQ